MGTAYVLIQAEKDVGGDELQDQLLELAETMTSCDAIEPVSGDYDVVIRLDAPRGVEQMVQTIEDLDWVAQVTVLPVLSHQDLQRNLTLKAVQKLS